MSFGVALFNICTYLDPETASFGKAFSFQIGFLFVTEVTAVGMSPKKKVWLNKAKNCIFLVTFFMEMTLICLSC